MIPYVNAAFVGTFTGKQISLAMVDPELIDIVDIAVGLANQCRYAGQVWPFYSVAEHSVIVSHMVRGGNPIYKRPLKALLHDAPEFILGDIIRPVKARIVHYDVLEERVMASISKKFELNYSKDDWNEIKRQDNLITVSERRKLMPRLDRGAYGTSVPEKDVPNIRFTCMNPPKAALAFLDRFWKLSGLHPTTEQAKLIDMIKETAA